MESKNIKLRKKFEPWAVLICFFVSALIMTIQFKLEDIYGFHFSVGVNNAIIGTLMFLLVCLLLFLLLQEKI